MIEILKSVLGHTCQEITGKQKRKVLVFSEFADTVDHLRGYLDIAFPGTVLVVNDRLTREKDRTVKANLDASWPDENQADEYQILLATEQGANIQRSRQIAGEKMFLIHSTIGEDVQILGPDE